MKKKKLLISVLFIAVFLMIASLALFFLVDLNSHKPRIETALSNALGLHVKIKGTIGFLLFPNLNISIGDIKITGRESYIASLEKVKFGLELLPLLKGKVIIDDITIKRPEISLVRFRNGEFNITQKIQKKRKEEEEEEKDTLPFAANNISLSDGDIVYTDHKDETVTKMNGIDVAIINLLVKDTKPSQIHELSFKGDIVYSDHKNEADTKLTAVDILIKDLLLRNTKKRSLIHDLSFKGRLNSKMITSHNQELSGLTFQMSAKEGLYNIKELSTTLFSGQGKGKVTFDVRGTTPTLKIQSTLSQFRLEEFLSIFSEVKNMEGAVDLSLNFSMQGSGMDEMKKTINGHTSMQGENLVISNYDIDTVLSKYSKSQNIGALDIGAFFLAGPVGTALTKGLDYEELHRSTGARGGIMKKFVSDWKVEKGIATAEDVAIATRENRIAVKGKLNLVNKTYDNIIVAVIDQKGCAVLTQKISGPLNNPQFEKTSVLTSVAGSVISIIGRAGKIIPGEQCEPFYKGSVQHP